MYKGKIPLCKQWSDEGMQVPAYPQSWQIDDKLQWFDNLSFEATICVIDMSRGRSAANFAVTIGEGVETPDFLHGATCTLFMRDLLDIIEHEGIKAGGEVSGTFCFCKRGQNYGIQLYREAE